MAADLRVHLLGPLEVYRGGMPVAVAAARSATVLVALALSPGRPVAIETLAERVWGDTLPAHVDGSLRSHVMRLRRALGADAITTLAAGFRLDVDPDQVDVFRFRRLVAEAAGTVDPARAAELLDVALALWRGEPLCGIRSEALTQAEIPSLLEERALALERRIEIELAAGRAAGVVGRLRRLARRFPLRESLWRQLITALAASGRQAEAVETYHDVRSRLRDELGLDPSAELQALYRRLLAGHSRADAVRDRRSGWSEETPRCQLPAGPSRFTGRQSELTSLQRLLTTQPPAAGRILIVALVGTAGVGKTALALHWARQMAERFPDGQLWIDLRGYGPRPPADPATVLEGFLQALGTPTGRIPARPEARAALFRSVTTGGGLLIIADNARDSDQVRPLLPGPGNLLLITSRSQLRGLVAFDGAHRVTVDRLPAREAAELLERMLGSGRVAGQAPAVRALAELCAHLPLALTIAAERAVRQPSVPLADFEGDLRRQRCRLDALATGEDVATNLRAVFSWSYAHLDPETRRTFRRLGGHPGAELELSAAAALAGLQFETARSHLDRLAAEHLVEDRGGNRYALHDLLRAYAAERAQEEESTAQGEGEENAADHRQDRHGRSQS